MILNPFDSDNEPACCTHAQWRFVAARCEWAGALSRCEAVIRVTGPITSYLPGLIKKVSRALGSQLFSLGSRDWALKSKKAFC